jgi:hypothetical protein
MIPAGELGSVDWLVEHAAFAHSDGPGEGWTDEDERWAWIYRATKPSHAQWYDNRAWPYGMVPPSMAKSVYGE